MASRPFSGSDACLIIKRTLDAPVASPATQEGCEIPLSDYPEC
jgi:hypothetical protein